MTIANVPPSNLTPVYRRLGARCALAAIMVLGAVACGGQTTGANAERQEPRPSADANPPKPFDLVDASVPPEPAVDETISLAVVMNLTVGFDPATDSIRVRTLATQPLVVRATFTAEGTYAFAFDDRSSSFGWTVMYDEGSTGSETVTAAHLRAAPNGKVTRFLNFAITASEAATKPTTIRLRVQRQGVAQSRTLELTLLPRP
jgi:hypothetical protein